jgi:hypothetical protein
MDERRFDLLAKALTEASSRRDALKITVVGATAGLFGVTLAEDESEARKRDDRNRNHNRRRRGRRKRKFCDCPDNNEKNCVTKTLSKKKAKKLKNKHPNSYNGRCDDRCLSNDTECNTNRPGECCSTICCRDTTSNTGGICATDGGNCCNRPNLGGYCPASAPFCCGTAACCVDSSRCCASALNPTGTCCPDGYVCQFETGFCVQGNNAPRDAEVEDPTVARIRGGKVE